MLGRIEKSNKRYDQKHRYEESRLQKNSKLKKRNLTSSEKEFSRFEGVTSAEETTSDIVELINSDFLECKVQAIKALRKMLVKNLSEPLINEIIDLGLVPKVVQLLKYSNDVAQFEAAWVVTNLATGDTRQTRYLVEAGVVDVLIHLLKTGCENIQEQAAWALGNIAGDSCDFRDFALEKGVVKAVLHVLIGTDKLPLLQTTSWLLSILCKGSSDFKTLSPAIPVLRDLLKHEDIDLVSQCCWCLASLSEGTNRISELLDNNVPPYLIPLLTKDNEIIEPALQVIGNIVTGDELPTQVMIDTGVLPHLVRLLQSTSQSIRKECCWILSNILAGTKRQIQAVIDVNPFPSMFHLMTRDGLKTKKEIVWAIRNVTTGGTNDQIKHIVGQGVIEKLCAALAIDNNEVVQVSLRALEVILRLGEAESKPKGTINPMAIAVEECQGIEAIATHLSHENTEIYRKSFDILEQYFNTVEL